MQTSYQQQLWYAKHSINGIGRGYAPNSNIQHSIVKAYHYTLEKRKIPSILENQTSNSKVTETHIHLDNMKHREQIKNHKFTI